MGFITNTLDQYRIKDTERLVLLQKCTTIPKKTNKPLWQALQTQYKVAGMQDSIGMAICSIINSIITQKRIYFAMSRESLKELMGQDHNHNFEGFKNTHYAKILRQLYEMNIVKKIFEIKGKATGFEVIDSDLVLYLNNVNRNQQYLEISSFCNVGTNLGTSKGTEYHSNIVRSNEVTKVRRNIGTEGELEQLLNRLLGSGFKLLSDVERVSVEGIRNRFLFDGVVPKPHETELVEALSLRSGQKSDQS